MPSFPVPSLPTLLPYVTPEALERPIGLSALPGFAGQVPGLDAELASCLQDRSHQQKVVPGVVPQVPDVLAGAPAGFRCTAGAVPQVLPQVQGAVPHVLSPPVPGLPQDPLP